MHGLLTAFVLAEVVYISFSEWGFIWLDPEIKIDTPPKKSTYRTGRDESHYPGRENLGRSNHSDPGFDGFTERPIIRPLSARYRCRRPVTASHYNDDVRIESYRPAAFLFADKKRNGIRDPFSGCRDIKEHASQALRKKFPLAHDTPLSSETKRAADVVSDSRPRNIAAFWGEQMDRISRLKAALNTHQLIWGSFIDPAVKPDAGKVQTLTIRHLADQCGMFGCRWIDQFATGFPITGTLSRNGVYARPCRRTRRFSPLTSF